MMKGLMESPFYLLRQPPDSSQRFDGHPRHAYIINCEFHFRDAIYLLLPVLLARRDYQMYI